MMCSKRRTDLADSHFTLLHKEMGLLAEYSRSDAKSFLLLLRSLMPNSFKLKLIEYEFARDNGDPATAAQHLSQLVSSHIELLRDEIKTLFQKITSPSPDRISIDIFSRLGSNSQREILGLFMDDFSDHLSKANALLSLLAIREIRTLSQLVPRLLTWTYECLREGERFLFVASSPATTSNNSQHKSPVVSFETITAFASPNPGAKRVAADDEGEEGEVVGDDDDEEEDDFKTNIDGYQSLPNRNLTVNIYRLKMAYDLLPAIHKVYGQTKVDSRLLEGVITYSLSCIINFLLFHPENPSILGTDESVGSLFNVHPRDYFIMCLWTLSDMFKWTRTIFVQSDVPTAFEFHGHTLKSPKELLNILSQCIDELLDYEAAFKRRRPTGRKSEGHHAFTKALVFQIASLYWYLFITFATEHLFKSKAGTYGNMSANSVSFYPLNVATLFSTNATKVEHISEDSTNSPLLLLSCLLRRRKYDAQSRKYSFGQKDLDKFIAKIGPSDSDYRIPGIVSMEKVIELELALIGLLELPIFRNADFGSFVHTHPEVDRIFLQWISCGCLKNLFSIKSLEQCEQQRLYFLQNFSSICQQTLDDGSYIPCFIDHDFWIVPLTLRTVEYFGCRTVAQWLERVLFKKCGVSEECRLSAACFLVVLCQIDSVAVYGSLFSQHYPLPCNAVLTILRDNWSAARLRLYPWILSSQVLSDAALLNQLVQFEGSYRTTHQAIEHPDFAEACIECIKSSSSVPDSTRLSSFVQSEASSILSCLKCLEQHRSD